MSISLRSRFEIFKRDDFTCRYCGRKSPEVVLEVDHIIPKSKKGNDSTVNLVTSCFECNRGKADKNLSEIITGEDPHDRAIELLERERQLSEYNEVLQQVENRVNAELKSILDVLPLNVHVSSGIRAALYERSMFEVFRAIKIAIERRGGDSRDCIPYFWGILRNWKNDAQNKSHKA